MAKYNDFLAYYAKHYPVPELTPSKEDLAAKCDDDVEIHICVKSKRRSYAETRKKSFYAEQRKKNIARNGYGNVFLTDTGVLHCAPQSDARQFWKKVDRRDIRHASKRELNAQIHEYFAEAV